MSLMCYGPYSNNLSTFTLLKQIAQVPQNLLLARVKVKNILITRSFEKHVLPALHQSQMRAPAQLRLLTEGFVVVFWLNEQANEPDRHERRRPPSE